MVARQTIVPATRSPRKARFARILQTRLGLVKPMLS
jgi:hypothetical protein